jgi:hypothetical protein
MQTGCTRLAVKQWPGIGVAMECARDAPLPRPSAVLPCACDFTRCDPASLGASLYSPRHTDLCGQCDAGRTLRPGLGVTMELETLPFGGRRSFAVRMWCSKVLRPWELCSSHLATTLLDRARARRARETRRACTNMAPHHAPMRAALLSRLCVLAPLSRSALLASFIFTLSDSSVK